MSSHLLSSVIGVLAYGICSTTAISTKAGSTVNIDGSYYYVPSTTVSSLRVSWDQLKIATTSGDDLIPITVMTGDFSTFDASALESIINSYSQEDDVFSTGFLQGTIHSPNRFRYKNSS
jgi:hypothetical protein